MYSVARNKLNLLKVSIKSNIENLLEKPYLWNINFEQIQYNIQLINPLTPGDHKKVTHT